MSSGDTISIGPSLTPCRNLHPLRCRPRDHRRQHHIEQRLRDEPIKRGPVLPALDRADIRPRPAEAVEFGDHDPAAFGIEPDVRLHPRRDFEGVAGLRGLLRRHGHDEQLGVPVHLLPRDHDDDGAVLASILLAPRRLMCPQVSV